MVKEIEDLRQLMLDASNRKGYRHPEVIQISQALDELINKNMGVVK